MIKSYNQLFENNKKWVAATNEQDPEFFTKLANGQSPKFLWIGCSDSRVPANALTGTMPGDIFVHRNIANMVIHTDMSMLSVLDYSVNVLGVQHIIVCGHYGCGGVAAAMGNKQVGLIDNWLRHIKDVYRLHQDELNSIEDRQKRTDRFVELNVIEQVMDLAKTSIVQNAWANKKALQVHGVVYAVGTGVLQDLGVTMDSANDMENVYKMETPPLA
ncbi:carbonate dehydratase [Dyadobacter fanqingshengii]|uniref:Carbonic anhydrase 2 n=1 Tax=Dyadobacter fanqingshengii TaxID=2906443 RepID=A0A9X1PG36_9BACT|nr:carbonate dehydratase [Dyadobacter fanqingshengii]MCF0043165.1 carbonate dehydratase [Dyadobacter fanqingshengii]MCF0043243.1 carbonate dehydratase [Dyadobacter fanqingshengii]MCF2506741.1 carbonate dehydratase [Dyadobacter fanqingshengii]USJ35718.1 carbonate dehydratase [Dyadobacter fanqingshengii]